MVKVMEGICVIVVADREDKIAKGVNIDIEVRDEVKRLGGPKDRLHCIDQPRFSSSQ